MTANIDTKGRVIYMLEKNSRLMENLMESNNQSTRAPTHTGDKHMKDTHVDYTKDFMFGLDIIKEGMHKIGMWSLEGFGVQLK